MKAVIQAFEVEESVISALITFPDAYLNNEDTLHSELFYNHRHIVIFKAIHHLYMTKMVIDMVTVATRLAETKTLEVVGGYGELSKLSMKVSSQYHLSNHIKKLQEKHIQRTLVRYGQEVVVKSQDPNADILELLDSVQSDILAIGNESRRQEAVKVHDVMVRERNSIDEGKIESWIPCHIDKIEKFVSGQFTILAARPSHGKSALMLDIADRQARAGHPVAIFSLEMKDREKIYRIWQKHTKQHPDKIKKKHLSAVQIDFLDKTINDYKDVHLYVDCDPVLTTEMFKVKARRLVKTKGVKEIWIDYIQLMQHRGAFSREREVSEISRTIKEIAMELDIAIIGLSQLNRDVESRPKLEQFGKSSDLRDSGSLEQDADNVMFLTNFNMLGLESFPEYGDVVDKAMLEITKSRGGNRGHELLNMSNGCMSWDSVREESPQPEGMPF